MRWLVTRTWPLPRFSASEFRNRVLEFIRQGIGDDVGQFARRQIYQVDCELCLPPTRQTGPYWLGSDSWPAWVRQLGLSSWRTELILTFGISKTGVFGSTCASLPVPFLSSFVVATPTSNRPTPVTAGQKRGAAGFNERSPGVTRLRFRFTESSIRSPKMALNLFHDLSIRLVNQEIRLGGTAAAIARSACSVEPSRPGCGNRSRCPQSRSLWR